MGRFKEAEEKFNTSRLMRKQIFGENNVLYADSLMNLARLFKKEGKYEKSAQYYYNSLKIRRDYSDSENICVSINLYELSQLMVAMNKKSEALSLNQKALDVRRIIYGKNHPRYARGLYYNANVLMDCGMYEEAVKKLEEAISMQIKYLGEKSLDYKDTVKALAKCRLDMFKLNFESGNYQKAMELYNIAVSDSEKEGIDIFSSYGDKSAFAPLFAAVGNISEAINIIKNSEKEILLKYGECSQQYAEFLKNEGKTYILEGNIAEAEKKLVKCLETEYLIPENGGKSADEISVLLGNAFRNSGDLKKAESYYKKAIQNNESRQHYLACYGMGKCEYSIGNFKEAMEYFSMAKEGMEKYGEYENKIYSEDTWLMGKICEKEKNTVDAERYCNISICTRRLLGDRSISYLNDLVRLGNLMKRNGNKSEALSSYNEASAGILSLKGENEEYAKLITKMAKLNIDIGRNDAAENLFKKAAEVYKKIYGSESDEYAAAVYDLLLFCVKTGKAVQAAESVQNIMQIVEKNISSRFRDEKYASKIKKLYEKIQKM